MFSDLPTNPTDRTLRQFAGGWFLVFITGAVRQLVHHHKLIGIALVLVALIGLAGLVKPVTVKHLFIGATIAATPLGWVVTQLMLAIMFYLVLTPIALIRRLCRHDPLQLRRKNGKDSCWVPRGNPPPPENYLKQY